MESAFALFRMWNSLAMSIAFFGSPIFSWGIKVFFMIVVLNLTFLGFVIFSSDGENFFLRFCHLAKSQCTTKPCTKLQPESLAFLGFRVFCAVSDYIFYLVENLCCAALQRRKLAAELNVIFAILSKTKIIS